MAKLKSENKLNTVATYIDQKDIDKASDVLSEFVKEHPKDWLQKILLSDLISEPLQPGFDLIRNLGVVTAILKIAKTDMTIRSAALSSIQIMTFSESVFLAREMIAEKLKTISAFSRQPSQQLYRIAAFLESQHAYAEKQFLSRSTWTMSDALVDSLETKHGICKSSFAGGLESLSDFLDVVIKYIYYTYDPKSSISDLLDNGDTPYDDPDFELMIIIAAYWHELASLWDSVRCNHCLPRQLKGGFELIATNSELMISKEVGIHRAHQQASEWHSFFVRRAPGILLLYNDLVSELARQVIVSKDNTTWKYNLDLQKLGTLYSHPVTLFMGGFDDERSFTDSKILQNIYIKLSDSASVSLESFSKIWRAVRLLAQISKEAIRQQVASDTSPFDFVPVLSYVDLVSLVVVMTGIHQVTIQNALDRIIFIEKRTRLELNDRPFLPVNSSMILFLPNVALSSNMSRVMQNYLGNEGAFFDRRGKIFEKTIVSTLKKNNIPVKHGVKFKNQSYPEFDIILHWGNFIFLVETKCVNHVATVRELFSAKKHVDYSIEQLMRRKQFLLSNWDAVRQHAPELKLPQHAYAADNIVCVSVNSSMAFTGCHENDVLVVDDICFLRYFGEKYGTKTVMYLGKVVTEEQDLHIRYSESPQPEEFYRYLRKPPQRERYLGKIEIQKEVLRPIENGMAGYLFPVAKTVQYVDEMVKKP